MVERVKFRNKEKSRGFHIISLKSFFEAINTSYIRKHFRADFYNLIFVTQGKCINEIDFLEYTVGAGELLVISKNRVHRYNDFENLEGYIIMFTEEFLCKFLSHDTPEVKELFKESYLNPVVNFFDLDTSYLINLLDVIHDMYTNIDEFMNNKVIASALKTLMLLFNSSLAKDTLKQKKNEIFIQFTELVETHIDKEKTVEGYAKMMHVSKKTVNLMTRKAIDMSAKQYIIQQLILKIKIKLCFEQKSINEIAYELGFTESSNMSRVFKKYTGVTPRIFRSIAKKENKWINRKNVDLNIIEKFIEKHVYNITSKSEISPHIHEGHDQIFYCIKGSGFGILQEREVELNVGDLFIAQTGTIHSLRSDGNLYVTAFLIPVVE